MLADGEWVMHNRHLDRGEYAKLAGGFYPSLFDAREWTKLFKEAGAQYITFTSRHHDGFSMWATKASPYNIMDATPFKRDIIGELAQACREQDLKLHFYYSHMDWQRTDYPTGACQNCPHDPSTTNWDSYYAFMNRQLTELLTNYGPIGAIWFEREGIRLATRGAICPHQALATHLPHREQPSWLTNRTRRLPAL